MEYSTLTPIPQMAREHHLLTPEHRRKRRHSRFDRQVRIAEIRAGQSSTQPMLQWTRSDGDSNSPRGTFYIHTGRNLPARSLPLSLTFADSPCCVKRAPRRPSPDTMMCCVMNTEALYPYSRNAALMLSYLLWCRPPSGVEAEPITREAIAVPVDRNYHR